jgi:hypothetical protein
MSVFKTTFSRALAVLKSDDANVPYPAIVKSGTNTSLVNEQLVDSAGDFINAGVKTGDIVYNTTGGSAATVVSVTSATVIVLNTTIFGATGDSYTIYQASSQTTIGNAGCFLYIGNNGGDPVNVKVTTIGGDIVTFSFIPVGTFLPVQVIKVWETDTTATQIVALW